MATVLQGGFSSESEAESILKLNSVISVGNYTTATNGNITEWSVDEAVIATLRNGYLIINNTSSEIANHWLTIEEV